MAGGAAPALQWGSALGTAQTSNGKAAPTPKCLPDVFHLADKGRIRKKLLLLIKAILN